MVYINDQYRFIFIENPKSGSTSILKALSESLNIPINRTPHLQNAHQTCDQIKQSYPDKWDEYLKVTTWRDPYNRFCSSVNYPRHHHLRGLCNFEQMKQHIERQYPYDTLKPFCQYCISQEKFTDGVNFIIKTDSIQEDYNQFCLKVGIPSVPIKNINTNNVKIYTEDQIKELLFLVKL